MSTTNSSWLAAAAGMMPINYAPIWKPTAPGEAIAGRLVRVDRTAGKDGTSTVYEIEQQDGTRVAFWGSTAILAAFERERACIGDVLALKFFGERVAERSGRTFKSYGLAVLERGGQVPF